MARRRSTDQDTTTTRRITVVRPHAHLTLTPRHIEKVTSEVAAEHGQATLDGTVHAVGHQVVYTFIVPGESE